MLWNFAIWTVVAFVVLRWQSLPGPLRGWILKLLLVAGIACFGVAPFLEGSYVEEVILYIGGPNPYRVEEVSRSWTGLALGIGLVFFAASAIARWGLPISARTPYGKALQITLFLIALRIYLEKLGVPEGLAMSVGIIWLIVPLAFYFGAEAARVRSQKKFWAWVFGYTYTTRGFVLVLMMVVTRFRLGTHFDNSSVTQYSVFGREYAVEAGSWEQYFNLIVVPQLVLWPAVTLLAAILLGLPTYLIFKRRLSATQPRAELRPTTQQGRRR